MAVPINAGSMLLDTSRAYTSDNHLPDRCQTGSSSAATNRTTTAMRVSAGAEAAEVPDPDAGEWGAWEALLASRVHDLESEPSAAMCVVTDTNYGTLSSSLIALPAPNMEGRKPVWRFSAGCPGEVAYDAVAL
jgi:hypothetical protein